MGIRYPLSRIVVKLVRRQMPKTSQRTLSIMPPDTVSQKDIGIAEEQIAGDGGGFVRLVFGAFNSPRKGGWLGRERSCPSATDGRVSMVVNSPSSGRLSDIYLSITISMGPI